MAGKQKYKILNIVNLGSYISTLPNLLGIGNHLNIKTTDHYPPNGDRVVAFLRFFTNNKNLSLRFSCIADKTNL